MIFSGLGDKQAKVTEEELQKMSIIYKLDVDHEILNSNKAIARNPLTYINPSIVSTADILSIEIDDEILNTLSPEKIQALHNIGLNWGEDPFDKDEIFEKIVPPKDLIDKSVDGLRNNFVRLDLILALIGLIIFGVYKLMDII